MLRSVRDHLENSLDKLQRYPRVEEVTHRVDEYYSAPSPGIGLCECGLMQCDPEAGP